MAVGSGQKRHPCRSDPDGTIRGAVTLDFRWEKSLIFLAFSQSSHRKDCSVCPHPGVLSGCWMPTDERWRHGSYGDVDSLGVPMSPMPHVSRHRTEHIRGLIYTERTHPHSPRAPAFLGTGYLYDREGNIKCC
jgi:hypothetical protein